MFEKEHVKKQEVLSADSLVWVNDNFETIGQEQYFKELVSTVILLCVYVNPLQELHCKINVLVMVN